MSTSTEKRQFRLGLQSQNYDGSKGFILSKKSKQIIHYDQIGRLQ